MTIETEIVRRSVSTDLGGARGASAYELWLLEGNVGTLEEFLTSLEGPLTDIEIGTVTTTAPGTPAEASLTGDAPDKLLNLSFPRGDPGSVDDTIAAVINEARQALANKTDKLDIQVFTTVGANTWNKPANSYLHEVICQGPGGPGGGGPVLAASTAGSGGGGGGGGSRNRARFRSSELPSSVSVVVGNRGTPGSGATSPGPGGNATQGSSTTFGAYLTGYAGGAGAGGSAGANGAGGGGAGSHQQGGNATGASNGTAGAIGGGTGGTSSSAVTGSIGAGAGAGSSGTGAAGGSGSTGTTGGAGSGGGITAANATFAGGAGAKGVGGATGAGPAGGTAPGGAGQSSNTAGTLEGGGYGGGGGASSTTTDGGAGGDGGDWGGGGGGGGATQAGHNGGNGGAGGRGFCLVISWIATPSALADVVAGGSSSSSSTIAVAAATVDWKAMTLALANADSILALAQRLDGVANSSPGWITAARVRSDGHTIEVDVSSSHAAAAFDPTQMYLDVYSEGYRDAEPVIWKRRISVLGAYRDQWPNHLSQLKTTSGGTTTFVFQLSDFVFDDDRAGGDGTSGVDPRLFVNGAWGVDGGPAPAQTIAMTNGSALDYPAAFAKWAIPPKQSYGATIHAEVMGSSWGAGIAGFNAYGKTLDCVRFTATGDLSFSSVQALSTSITKSTWRMSSLPCMSFAADIDTTPFLSLESGKLRYEAFPVIGDEDSIYDSNSTAFPSRRGIATVPILIDKGSSYGTIYVAWSTTGNDSTGVASVTQATAEASPFANLSKALYAAELANLAAFGRKDLGNVQVLHMGGDLASDMLQSSVQPESVDFTQASAIDGLTWLTIKPGTGAASCRIVPHATSTKRALPNWTRLASGITVAGTSTWALHGNDTGATASKHIWFDQCDVTGNGVQDAYIGFGFMYRTGGTLTTAGPNALGSFSNWNNNWVLARNFVADTPGTARVQHMQAADFTNVGGGAVLAEQVTGGYGQSMDGRIAGNIRAAKCTSFVVSHTVGYQTGALLFNLELEGLSNLQPIISWSADAALDGDRNFHLFHSTSVGGRSNIGYDDAGATGVKTLYQVVGNIIWNFNNKDDTFDHPTLHQNGARDKNRAIGAHVGWEANVILRGSQANDAGGSSTVAGPLSWLGEYLNKNGVVCLTDSDQFVDCQFNTVFSASGPFTAVGGSNLAPSVAAVSRNRLGSRVAIPFDIAGAARVSSAGAREG